MAFLALVEIMVFVFGLYVLVSQVLVPLFRGTRLFPFFGRKTIREEMIDVLDEAERAELQALVERLRKEFEAKYKSTPDITPEEMAQILKEEKTNE